MNSKHAIGIHGYVLVYSIASRNSFDMIQTVYDKILNYTGTEHVPCVCVGQKSDLHVQRCVAVLDLMVGTLLIYVCLGRVRQVSEAEGKELAAKLKCAWVETSARHNANVGRYLLLPSDFRLTLYHGSSCSLMT